MEQDRCSPKGSLFGSNCSWIIIIVVIFIIFTCFCNNKKDEDNFCYPDIIF